MFWIIKDMPKHYEKIILINWSSNQVHSSKMEVTWLCVCCQKIISSHTYLETKWVLKNNLQNLFAVFMALCDTKARNQVNMQVDYKVMDKKQDLMALLKTFKKYYMLGEVTIYMPSRIRLWPTLISWVYISKSIKTSKIPGSVNGTTQGLYWIGTEIWVVRGQYKGIILEAVVTKPNNAQLKEVLDWVEEEHQAIVFLYKPNKQIC